MSIRESALQSWLHKQLHHNNYALSLLAGDASFRRYYRVLNQEKSWVIMDAPPEFEPIAPFIEVAKQLSTHGIHVPKIIAVDQEQGFILMEDLGDTLFLDALNADSANHLYEQALDLLHIIQSISVSPSTLQAYDYPRLFSELNLFIEWFCQQYLKLNLSDEELKHLNQVFSDLAHEVAHQPTCFVHRDYHSRNIMVLEGKSLKLSIIDFQDAVIGPYAYDVVSLLKDCYVDWPDDQQQQWCYHYFQNSPFHQNRSFEQFMLDYHMCGLQRHIRVLGTFSRLYLRDGKNRYLADMPRILNYINQALLLTGRYPFLQQFFTDKVRLP